MSDEAQMTECTHETLRLAPKTVTKTHEERLRPYALQVLLDAHADAWKRDLILKGDGLCLGHGVYSVDEDNPDGDCKACMAEASLTASQERVRELERDLGWVLNRSPQMASDLRLHKAGGGGDVMKTWQVGPQDKGWVAIVHADSRGKARQIGARIDFNEFTDMRAIRLARLDGKPVTVETLIDAGFPETVEGEPIDPFGYIDFCPCDDCRRAMNRPTSEPPGEEGT